MLIMKLDTKKSKKIFIILFHIIAWVLFISLPFFGTDIKFNNERIIFHLLSSVTIIAFFYINYFILIPKFFLQKKYLIFIVINLILVVLLVFIDREISRTLIEHIPERHPRYLRRRLMKRAPNFFRFRIISMCVLIFLSSLALRLLQNWNMKEKQLKEAESERIKSELSYLKFQVSPHFLFNTLNSVYSLSVEKSDKTPGVVLKLSELMRYMLYTGSQRLVGLSDEIEHIKSYIELQKLRLFDVVDIKLNIKNNKSDCQIEPMLLIPFVENAFKHGVSYTEKCEISISIKFEDNILIFESENYMFNNNAGTEIDSGIGLSNVKRRLELLYKGKYDLKISEIDNKYKVKLVMRIKGLPDRVEKLN